jgi:hypothetical protein
MIGRRIIYKKLEMVLVAKRFKTFYFWGEFGPFLKENSLFPKEVALFPRGHLLLLMKVRFFWGSSFVPWGNFLVP